MTTHIARHVARVVPSRAPQNTHLVVTLTPEGLHLREFGKRKKCLLPYGYAYLRAVYLHVENERREKKSRAQAREQAKATP